MAEREETEARLGEIAEQVARMTAENARLLARLGEGERRFRLISRGVVRAQEAERGRISRELHDGVGQSLTALKMQLELLEQEAAAAESGLAARARELRDLAERALQEVRQISRLIRPPMLDELGLGPTLRWLARTVQAQSGVPVELDDEGREDRLDPESETLVFRLVQEALTNVAKHARARSARVRVRLGPGTLHVAVEDDGGGFDAAAALASEDPDRCFGVRGMRDRVHLVGGRFALRSSPGTGTTVEAEIPLPSVKGA